MPFGRFLSSFAWAALALLLVIAASACGDDDDGAEVTPAEGLTPTPFSLGTTLTIRGEEVTLPPGVTYVNQSPECQQEDTAMSPQCIDDPKMLMRGDSYILFDPSVPRVIARRIEPEDESDFRPLLGIIAGTTDGNAAGASPSP